jgi:lipopolysaccharide/colanic/teichoic acid biosynthesis glycosyltransferase
LSSRDQIVKRLFDVLFSALGLLACWPVILVCWIIAATETRSNGFFIQDRVGRFGKSIKVIKIKTMYPAAHGMSSITALNRHAITRSGRIFRKYKLDELPQLLNVLVGHMSFVGPRPDVRGYADQLRGRDRVILLMRPGITGPASIKYRDEDTLLTAVADPDAYNAGVIWPEKVRLNKEYYFNYSLWSDIRYILKTVLR